MLDPQRVTSCAWLILLLAGASFPQDSAPDPCPFAHQRAKTFQWDTLELDGCSLYHEREGSGPALVLVHGACTHGVFHPVLSRLARGNTVIYFDQRGYGRTRVSRRKKSTTAQDVADLEALRRKLDKKKIALLAWSYGGPMAIAYARKHPDRVRRLILVDTFAHNDDRVALATPMVKRILYEEGGIEKQKAIAQDRSLSDREKTIRKWLALPHTHHHSPLPRKYVELWMDGDIFLKDPKICSDREANWLPELEKIDVPTLVICGRHDAITPLAHSRKMARLLPRGRLVVFERSGHCPPLEEEDRFIEIVSGFLSKKDDGTR